MMNIAGKYSQETIGQVGKLEENSGPGARDEVWGQVTHFFFF